MQPSNRLAVAALAHEPCIGCRRPTGGLCGSWSPSLACRRDELGVRPDRPVRLAYAICAACARRASESPDHGRIVEDRLIERYRTRCGAGR